MIANAGDIESLSTFALANNEVSFAHLCTEALAQIANPNGDQWAVERIAIVIGEWCFAPCDEDAVLELIQNTDTTRPDGAVARSFTF